MANKKTSEEFIREAQLVHKNRYSYSKVKYINNATKILLVCPIHGEFWQLPISHLTTSGCLKCHNENVSGKHLLLTQEEFINRSNVVHDNRYDYSRVNYKNNKTKVKIICPIHGEFEQNPGSHLLGSGCPECKESKGEKKIKEWLEYNNIKYIIQESFKNKEIPCKNNYTNKLLRFDFYLPDYNLCIEYDGPQHFKKVDYYGGENGFELQQQRDKIKTQYCKDNGIELLRIQYWKINNIEEILNEKLAELKGDI